MLGRGRAERMGWRQFLGKKTQARSLVRNGLSGDRAWGGSVDSVGSESEGKIEGRGTARPENVRLHMGWHGTASGGPSAVLRAIAAIVKALLGAVCSGVRRDANATPL